MYTLVAGRNAAGRVKAIALVPLAIEPRDRTIPPTSSTVGRLVAKGAPTQPFARVRGCGPANCARAAVLPAVKKAAKTSAASITRNERNVIVRGWLWLER